MRSSVICLVTQVKVRYPEKLQRIQDATPPATDSATSAAEVQGSSEDAAFELLSKEIEDSIFHGWSGESW